MPAPDPPLPRRHVLLAGIDAYERVDPLFACVNDVDAVEAILLDRLNITPECITKLVAPHPWHERRPRLPEKAPTAENLRAALEALAGEAVQAGDRVLIYYAGHGTQVLLRHTSVAREALVPVDAHPGGDLLYDDELNSVLARIARRTSDLTVILDCCCSAGTTRSTLLSPDSAVRFCRIEESTPPPYPAASSRDASEPPAGFFATVDPADPGYLVAAACQSNERALEARSGAGPRHGAFTAALLRVLALQPDRHLDSLRWADLWQALRHQVLARSPGQHPWLIGRAERRIFGGAFQPRDPGYPVVPDGKQIRILAGAMVGLSPGAKVAVYGPEPDLFPPLGSAEDRAARLGELVVQTAAPSSCTAAPLGSDFALIDGARGRLLAPGAGDTLVVQLDPYDAKLARWLEGEGPLRVVPADRPPDEIAEAFVGMDAGGKRWIGDDIHGPAVAGGFGEPPLAWLDGHDWNALLRGLLHYQKYNIALRLSHRCRDLPGALSVCLLDCSALSSLTPKDMQDPPLPEAQRDLERRYRYLLAHGQPVCITVENRASQRLYANLINCTACGRVEILGSTQMEIPSGRRQTFWLGGTMGKPFLCGVPKSRSSGVDRLIAVGTTVPDVDLSFLRQKKTLEEAMRSEQRHELLMRPEPNERWTAALVTIKITRTSSLWS